MIYFNKVLPFFISPLFIVLVLLVAGVATRRRIWVIGAICLLYVASTPLVSQALLAQVESGQERLAPADVPKVDAVVVLSGGMGWVKTKRGFAAEWATPGRFWGGIELFQAGNAPLLVFTGGKLPWQQAEETEGDVLKRYAVLTQIPADNILVTEGVENTEQEAIALKKLLQSDAKKIILVTSALHMPRAQQSFKQAGFEVFPYPVNSSTRAEHINILSFLPMPGALSESTTAFRELFGRLYYQVKHLLFASVV